MWVESRVTDSFLDLAELLESLAEGVIVGVPREAAIFDLVRFKYFFFGMDQKMGEKFETPTSPPASREEGHTGQRAST